MTACEVNKVIKVLCCGDPHFQPSNTVETTLLTERFVNQAAVSKPDFIVVLGDLIHTHERGHIPSMNNAYDFLDKLRKVAPTYCLIGNHDILHNKCFLTRIHGFNPLKEWKNIFIIDKPEIHTIKGHSFVFCPYTEPGKLFEALTLIDVPLDQKASVAVIDGKITAEELLKIKERNIQRILDASAVFCHQEFKDSKIGILKSAVGDVWPDKYPLAISGHIHDYHKLKENIIYVGTPAQYNFGENAKKTVSLFTFCYQKWEEFRIDLKIPRKMTIDIDYKDFSSFVVPVEGGDKIRLIVSGTSSQLKELDKSQKKKDLIKLGVKVCGNPIPDEKIDESIVKLYSSNKRKSYIETFKELCTTNNLDTLFNEVFGSSSVQLQLPLASSRIMLPSTSSVNTLMMTSTPKIKLNIKF